LMGACAKIRLPIIAESTRSTIFFLTSALGHPKSEIK